MNPEPLATTELAPEDLEAQRLQLSEASCRALELPSILAVVAEGAATDLGQQHILGLEPLADEGPLRQRRQRFEEVERLLTAQTLVPLAEQPLLPLIAELASPHPELNGRRLLELARMLSSSLAAARRVNEADPPCPSLAARLAELPSAFELERHIRRTFDKRGEIREDASPALGRLRQRIRQVRGRIYEELSGYVERERDHLGEETIPMRGGRLVLVLQAGAKGRVPGLIHGRSGTGKSFYFEPLETVESNNQLQQAAEEEEAERRRILAELLERLREALPALRAHAQWIAELDSLQAASRFRELCSGCLADIAPQHQLRLLQAKHPLLDPALAERRELALGTPGHTGPIVPLDLELDGDPRVLVLTGPNAGGKTVALKTLGLLALMHQCGLPVPAQRGTRLPLLSGVVATVGDEQDLLADRSTFSGRLLRLKEAWEIADESALVLLDELGSGTDPEEGAALAIALVEGLLQRRSLALITTHLTPVAAAAMDNDGARCAAMEFDGHTGEPTYRLLPGPPGGSEALALARRLELPEAWVQRAEELLGPEHRNLQRLLAEVERSRKELTELRQQLAGELRDAETLRRRLAEQEAAVADERKTLSRDLKRQLDAFRDQTARRLRGELDRLRQELEKGRRKGLVAAATARLFSDTPTVESEADEEVPLSLGARVRHRQFGWEGTLEKLDRGKAQVNAGGKIFRCREEELNGIKEAKKGDRPRQGRQLKPRVRPGPGLDDPGESAPELNLIGRRVEPALEALDDFLDHAIMGSRQELRIVHGHGSGRLRDAVRQHLRRHPAVAAHRPGKANEGGNGATVLTLRGA